MADDVSRKMRLFQEALTEQREFMEKFVDDTTGAMSGFWQQLAKVGDETRRIGEKTNRLAEETSRIAEETSRIAEETSRIAEETRRNGEAITRISKVYVQSTADLKENYQQLFGRMRLSEGRLSAMLDASDHDRQELRELYQELERRLSEVERRLPPSAA